LLPRRYRPVVASLPRPCTIATDHTTTGRAPQPDAPEQEAVMGKAIPTQHPAVVLRSHFNALRALLAAALIAVVGLSAAVVILATDDDRDTSAGSTTQVSAPSPTGSTRYDGGPEEGTRGIVRSAPQPTSPLVSRYDGGPEEGTADVSASQPRVTQSQAFPGLASEASRAQADEPRYDGGPEEGTRGSGH
jgi:hypothetical protein